MSTPLQIKAAVLMSENIRLAEPRPMGEVLLAAGYSPSMAAAPIKVLESDGYKEALEDLLPERLIKQRHQELLNSTTIGEYEFFAKEIMNEEAENDDEEDSEVDANEDEEHAHIYKGRKKQSYRRIKKRVPIDDNVIREIIESVPGCKIVYIKAYSTGTKIAYFQQPDNRSRKDAVDMAYKLRGDYAPEKKLNMNLNKDVTTDNPKVAGIVKRFRKELKEAILTNDGA